MPMTSANVMWKKRIGVYYRQFSYLAAGNILPPLSKNCKDLLRYINLMAEFYYIRSDKDERI